MESTEIENQSLKFKPDLNLTEAKNKNLLKNQDRSGIERLSHWKAHKESKIHQVGKLIEEESMMHNNYQPEINKTSKSIMNKAQASVNRSLGRPEDAPFNRHEQLYYDACQRIKKREEIICNYLPEEYTFQPNVGPSRFKIRDELDQKDMIERLQCYNQKKEETIEKHKREQNELVDKATGQKLFKPKINNYKMNRNVTNVDIGD